ncbi:MAG: chromate efflux transporter [Moraxellaceae bacterium]|nr:chromate efflux transporter [Moraxellaceae bacterium]MDZ4387273.1 chromate efflux transporter [Moraxellaceae bacterium]
MTTPATNTQNISLWQALGFWLKLGFISFGGPAGQIAIMHQELVVKRQWISERRFLHALNYCMMLPGPEAQQLATYLGWLMHRTWGGIVAGALFVLPSLLILITLSWVYLAYGDVALVAGLFYGIKPAVAAIVLHAVHRIGSKALKNSLHWALAAAAFVAIFALHVPFPAIVAGAALAGFLGGRYAPDAFNANTQNNADELPDDGPRPAHTFFTLGKLIRIIVIGALLWILPMLALVAFYGWEHTYSQMAWFFTKAALLTFGGAYAVLPYVYEGAVNYYSWLTPVQMIDGLALGEATPGPLIMVVAFVAFIGGYINEVFGPEQLFLAGAVAAIIVTWFTFLPSFLFILGGGPLVESTHGNLKFTAPLTGITAAVVGVILNLGLYFIYHVIWPAGFAAAIDWVALSITVAAVVALFVFHRGVITVLISCGLLGLASQWLLGA